MKTSSYFTYTGLGRIGISIGNPRNVLPGYSLYPDLAPRWNMLKLSYEDYRREFMDDILAALDPAQVVDDLTRLAGDAEPVLLCFERPPFTADNWCHRRMVAEWFADRIGIDVPELVIGSDTTPTGGGDGQQSLWSEDDPENKPPNRSLEGTAVHRIASPATARPSFHPYPPLPNFAAVTENFPPWSTRSDSQTWTAPLHRC